MIFGVCVKRDGGGSGVVFFSRVRVGDVIFGVRMEGGDETFYGLRGSTWFLVVVSNCN